MSMAGWMLGRVLDDSGLRQAYNMRNAVGGSYSPFSRLRPVLPHASVERALITLATLLATLLDFCEVARHGSDIAKPFVQENYAVLFDVLWMYVPHQRADITAFLMMLFERCLTLFTTGDDPVPLTPIEHMNVVMEACDALHDIATARILPDDRANTIGQVQHAIDELLRLELIGDVPEPVGPAGDASLTDVCTMERIPRHEDVGAHLFYKEILDDFYFIAVQPSASDMGFSRASAIAGLRATFSADSLSETLDGYDRRTAGSTFDLLSERPFRCNLAFLYPEDYRDCVCLTCHLGMTTVPAEMLLLSRREPELPDDSSSESEADNDSDSDYAPSSASEVADAPPRRRRRVARD